MTNRLLLYTFILLTTINLGARTLIDLANDVKGNLAVIHLNSGTNASAGTVWTGNNTWSQALANYTAIAPIAVNGTVISCNNCGVDAPTSSIKGTIIGGYIGAAGIGNFPPFLSSASGTYANGIVPFPGAGYLRSCYVHQRSTASVGLLSRFSLFKDNLQMPFTIAPGLVNGVAVGSYGNAVSYARMEQNESFFLKYAVDSTAGAVINAWTCEFIPDGNITILGSAAQIVVGTGATNYAPVFADAGSNIATATENTIQFVLPYAGTASNLMLFLTGAQPGTGTQVVTMRLNGADTISTITIPVSQSASSFFMDITHTFTAVAGDLVNFKIVCNAATSCGQINGISFAYTPASGGCHPTYPYVNCSGMFGAVNNYTATAGNTLYFTPFVNNRSTTEANQLMPMPFAVTITKCYAYVRTASSGGNTTVLTNRKNSGAGSLTVSIANGVSGAVASTGSDTFAVGDTYDAQIASVSGTGPVITSWSCGY